MSLKQDFIDSVAQADAATALDRRARRLFAADDRVRQAVNNPNSGITLDDACREFDYRRDRIRSELKQEFNLTDAEFSRLIELLK